MPQQRYNSQCEAGNESRLEGLVKHLQHWTLWHSSNCQQLASCIRCHPLLLTVLLCILVWWIFSCFLFVGFSPEQLQPPSQLVGCMRGVRFTQGDASLPTPIASKAAVTHGCMNACLLHNPCVNHGTCLNYYTHTMCDCFSTGFEGVLCERPGEIFCLISEKYSNDLYPCE